MTLKKETYLSHPTTVEVNNPWSYTSTSTYTFVACTGTNLLPRVSPYRSTQMPVRTS